MSEPESLDTDEPLARRIERHRYDRLIMLSDGVFAIAMTLLALEVRPPEHWSGDLAGLLAQTWRSLFGYGLSFLMVAVFWFANRNILARVRRVDGPYTALTLLFLALICLAPFATALVAEYGPLRSMRIYSILIGATGVVQALLWAYAAFGRPLLAPEVTARERWLTLAAFVMIPVWFSVVGLLFRSGMSQVTLPLLVAGAAVLGRARRRLMRGTPSAVAPIR